MIHTLTLQFETLDQLLDFSRNHLTPVANVAGPVPMMGPAPSEVADIKAMAYYNSLRDEVDISEDTTPLNYEKDVRPFALKLSKAEDGSPRLTKIFDDFGVTNAKELTAEQLPAFLTAVKKELGE